MPPIEPLTHAKEEIRPPEPYPRCFFVPDTLSLAEQVQAQNEELRRLNEDLEAMVEERSRSLELSQEILEKLPIPVAGVSREGMIVLSNEAARTTFPALARTPLGADMQQALPAEVTEAVTACLEGEPRRTLSQLPWDGREVALRIEPLKGGLSVRGCILIAELLNNGR